MWRLVEIGEVIENGDEYWQFGEWTKLPIGSSPTVKYVADPVRRWAGEKKPAVPAVSVGDRVEVVSGTWAKSCGVVVGILPMNLKITLENVFVGGSMLTLIVGKSSVTALKSAPKASVQVDPEWRLLEIGEVIREGDLVSITDWGNWTPAVDSIGTTIPEMRSKARRRVRIESPGWRYLDACETVQAGDETSFGWEAVWKEVSRYHGTSVGNPVSNSSVRFFRRKTTPFAG